MPTEREIKRIRQRSAAGVCTTPGRAPIPPPVATSPLRRPLLVHRRGRDVQLTAAR